MEKYSPPPHWPEYREEIKRDVIFNIYHRREFSTRVGVKPVPTSYEWEVRCSDAEVEATRQRALHLLDLLAREEWERQREECR